MMTIAATDNLVFVPDSSNAATGDIIEFKNTGMKAANDTGDPDTVTYDVALAKVV